jgi:hypothetical protein
VADRIGEDAKGPAALPRVEPPITTQSSSSGTRIMPSRARRRHCLPGREPGSVMILDFWLLFDQKSKIITSKRWR